MDELERHTLSDDERFAASVKRLREAKGWSQGELAKRMTNAGFDGFHQTTISRIEKGERPVRIGEARGLARVLESLVGIMIAPPEHWKIPDTFVREVILLSSAERQVGQAVVDYLNQRTVVKKAWKDLKALGEPDWLEAGLLEQIRQAEARATRLLSRNYPDAIDDAVDPDGHARAEASDAEK